MASQLVSIKWHPSYTTSQVYGRGTEMAAVSKDREMIGPWATCRDFFNDARRWELLEKSGQIYGYKYTFGKDPRIGTDKARVLLTNSDYPELQSKLAAAKDFMNQIEKDLHIPILSEYQECESPPEDYEECGVSYWQGSRKWILAPQLFWLWTFLLRNAHNHTTGKPYMETVGLVTSGRGNPGCENDAQYMSLAKLALTTLLKNGIKGCFPKPLRENWLFPKMQDHHFHHFSGAMTWTIGDDKESWPNIAKFPKFTGEKPWWLHA